LPFLSVFVIFDGIQGVCSGVLRGTGNQSIGAKANLFAFYALGIPASWFLCFKLGFGVSGLMIGISAGTLFQSVFLLYIIFFKESLIFTGINAENSNTVFVAAPAPQIDSSGGNAHQKPQDDKIINDDVGLSTNTC
jgi:MATE family multidrug resistance protein